MYNPDDNDIDRLSREAAEHYHAPGKPAWAALREALDKELPQEKEKKRRGFLFFFLLGLGLFVAGSAVWYGISANKNNNTNKIANADKDNTKIAGKTTPASTNKANDKNGAGTAGTSQNMIPPDDTHSTGKENSTPENSAVKASSRTIAPNVKKLAPVTVSPVKADITKNGISGKSGKTTPLEAVHYSGSRTVVKSDRVAQKDALVTDANKQAGENKALQKKQHKTDQFSLRNTLSDRTGNNYAGNQGVTGKKPNRKTTKGARNFSAETNPDNTKVNNTDDAGAEQQHLITQADTMTGALVVNRPPAVRKDTLAVTSMAATEQKDSVKTIAAKTKIKSKNEKAILLGITGGFDISTVKFNYGSDVGYNIGFMGGYQFNKHWSVYTGLVYTKKNYKLSGADYHPPAAYWTNWIDLQTVEGYCRMWELPVLARYTFNPQSKTAFFASAGISSYFMKNQEYTYSYKTTTGPAVTSPWTDNDNINHIFSILDLSAGFQKRIGQHMNWQVEPYAKIPLGGVGFGDIKLSSFGVNLTVQYRKLLKR